MVKDSSDGEQLSAAEYVGQGIDNSPRSLGKHLLKKAGPVRKNGHVDSIAQEREARNKEEKNLIVEDFQHRDGQRLSSLKRTDTMLMSGRKAGAGWERSK